MKRSPSDARVLRTDSRSGRFYDITHADGTISRYPSVTTILGAIAKPALISWSASTERTAVSEAAADLHADCAGQQLPRSMYLLALEQRLGKTKAHLKVLAKGADIGSQTHAAVEWSLKMQRLGIAAGPRPPLSEPARIAFEQWQAWTQAVALEPLLVEQCVWSRTHEYAGTMDLLARLRASALLALLERQGPVTATLGDWLRTRETVTACIDLKTSKQVWPESMLQAVAYQRALAEMGHGRIDGGLIVRLPKTASDPGFEVAVVPSASTLFPTFLAARQLWTWQHANDAAYWARQRGQVA